MTFVYNSEWNLDFYKERNIKMIDGEEYILSDITKQDYKGWKVISGKMQKTGDKGSAKYALAISPKEYKQLKKLI